MCNTCYVCIYIYMYMLCIYIYLFYRDSRLKVPISHQGFPLPAGKMVRVEEIVQLPHQLRVRALGTSSGLDYLAESGDGKAPGTPGTPGRPKWKIHGKKWKNLWKTMENPWESSLKCSVRGFVVKNHGSKWWMSNCSGRWKPLKKMI